MPIDKAPKLISYQQDKADHMNDLAALIHVQNANWWRDLETGEPLNRNVGELMMLIVSELAEGFEGVRKDLMDDHLTYRKMEEVEIADAIIRLLDYSVGRGIVNIGNVVMEKLIYNQNREDHMLENRRSANGKKF